MGAEHEGNSNVKELISIATFLLDRYRGSRGCTSAGGATDWAEEREDTEAEPAEGRVRELEERERQLTEQLTRLQRNISQLLQENEKLKARSPESGPGGGGGGGESNNGGNGRGGGGEGGGAGGASRPGQESEGRQGEGAVEPQRFVTTDGRPGACEVAAPCASMPRGISPASFRGRAGDGCVSVLLCLGFQLRLAPPLLTFTAVTNGLATLLLPPRLALCSTSSHYLACSSTNPPGSPSPP